MPLVLAVVLALGQTGAAPKPAIDLLASAIDAALKSAPKTTVSDEPIRVADMGGYNVGIYLVNRPKSTPQGAILHDARVSEVYYMLRGSGTLVTGGKLIDAKRLPEDNPIVTDIAGPSVTGSRIEGGESRRISKGDFVLIPAGLPHWWSQLDEDIAYLVVRPDPDSVLKKK
jgi:mannose-6-phosphate isomerase-like protein (cupin superfamily)